MDTNAQLTGKACNADYVVRTPRATDALGHTLRDVFGKAALPDDMMLLLRQLDHATH